MMELFRDLSEEDAIAFRAWARANYTPFTPIKGIWHPVIQEECTKMNREGDMTPMIIAGIHQQRQNQTDVEAN
jgi:hypothetical protein